MAFEPNTLETMGLIKELTSIPSPTGNTEQVLAFVENYLKEAGIASTRNHKGALLVRIPGKDDSKQRMLTAHVDSLVRWSKK